MHLPSALSDPFFFGFFLPPLSLCHFPLFLDSLFTEATNFADGSAVSCSGSSVDLEVAVSTTGQLLSSSHPGHPAAPPLPSTTNT